jgi:hypothetical protein
MAEISSDITGELFHFDETPGPVSAPSGLLVVAAALLVIAAGLTVVASDVTHLIGYGLSAVAVPAFVIRFRNVTRNRERSPYFVNQASLHRAAIVILVAAVLVAMLHGFLYSRSTVLA